MGEAFEPAPAMSSTEMDNASAIEEKPERKGCCGSKVDIDTARDTENQIVACKTRGTMFCGCRLLPFTDFPILLVFIGFFIGMIYVFGWACTYGNLNRLQYGTDYSGHACGDSDYGTADYKHQYWANPLYYS